MVDFEKYLNAAREIDAASGKKAGANTAPASAAQEDYLARAREIDAANGITAGAKTAPAAAAQVEQAQRSRYQAEQDAAKRAQATAPMTAGNGYVSIAALNRTTNGSGTRTQEAGAKALQDWYAARTSGTARKPAGTRYGFGDDLTAAPQEKPLDLEEEGFGYVVRQNEADRQAATAQEKRAELEAREQELIQRVAEEHAKMNRIGRDSVSYTTDPRELDRLLDELNTVRDELDNNYRGHQTVGQRIANTVTGLGKTYAGSMAGVGEWMANVEEAYEGAKAKNGGKTAHYAEEMGKAWSPANVEKAQRQAEYYQGLSTKLNESGAADIAKAQEGLGKTGRLAVNAGVALGQMGLDVGIGALTGGGSMLPMMVRSFGGGVQQAREKGYNVTQQTAMGLANAATEWFTEKLFGGNPAYDTDVGLVNRLVSKLTGNKALIAVLSSKPAEIVSEGLEEVASDILEPIAEYVISGGNWTGYDVDQMIEDGVIGMILGGFGQGGQYVTDMASGATKQGKTLRELGPDVVRSVVDEGLASGRDTDSYQMAKKLDWMLNNGQRISDGELGRAYRANVRAIEAEQRAAAGAAETQISPQTMQQQNAAPEGTAESTSVNTNPAGHSEQEQRVINEYRQAVDTGLVAFINKVRGLKSPRYRNSVRYSVSEVGARQADAVSRIAGVDATGFENIITGGTVDHIENRHGANGKADHSMADINDLARIQYVLENFDNAEPLLNNDGTLSVSDVWKNSDGTPAQRILFTKKVNGTYYAAIASPDSNAKVLAIESAYMNSKNGSTGTVLNMADSSTPQVTPEAPQRAYAPTSDFTIAQPLDAVNSGNADVRVNGIGAADDVRELPGLEQNAATGAEVTLDELGLRWSEETLGLPAAEGLAYSPYDTPYTDALLDLKYGDAPYAKEMARWLLLREMERETIDTPYTDTYKVLLRARKEAGELQTQIERANVHQPKGFTENEKRDSMISNEFENGRYKAGNDSRAVISDVIPTKEYEDRIAVLGESKEATGVMLHQARTTLYRRNGTDYEDLIYVDPPNATWKAQRRQDSPGEVSPTDEMKEMVLKNPGSIIGMHNHPHSIVPSMKDLLSARFYKYGVILCHNGVVIKYAVKMDALIQEADRLLNSIQDKIDRKASYTNELVMLRDYGVNMEVFGEWQ